MPHHCQSIPLSVGPVATSWIIFHRITIQELIGDWEAGMGSGREEGMNGEQKTVGGGDEGNASTQRHT